MKPELLVNLLLELNVLNVEDVDQELRSLAAHVYDPRGQKWLLRVARYWITNIDQLIELPYTAKAVERGAHSSKYYYDPAGGWRGQNKPKSESVRSLFNPSLMEAGEKLNVVYFKAGDEWQWMAFPPKSDRAVLHGSAPDEESAEAMAREAVLAGGYKLGRVKQEEPVDIDPEKTYTTKLGSPVYQRHLDQNFSPYTTRKAPKKSLYGNPPTADEAPGWVKSKEDSDALYHFDAIQVRRRELWLRLEYVVHYFNYLFRVMRSQTKPEKAKEAEAFFRRMETMKTTDADGFRDVLKLASEFQEDVETRPWKFANDGRVIAASGEYELRRAVSWQMAMKLAQRTTRYNRGKPTVWCVGSTEHYAKSYIKSGPLYFVDRDGEPYWLIHFETPQNLDATGTDSMDREQARDFAPLFMDEDRFPDKVLSKIPVLQEAVYDLRRRQAA